MLQDPVFVEDLHHVGDLRQESDQIEDVPEFIKVRAEVGVRLSPQLVSFLGQLDYEKEEDAEPVQGAGDADEVEDVDSQQEVRYHPDLIPFVVQIVLD